MIVNINGEKVVLDGRITVEKVSSGEYKVSSPDAAVEVIAGSVEDTTAATPMPELDPKWYKTSMNGLTVQSSVNRAFNRITTEMWKSFPMDVVYTSGPGSPLFDSIKKLIEEGKGRDAAYAIAGGIKKGMEEGKYKGVPLAYIFKGIVDGDIKQPMQVQLKAKPNPIWNYR